MNEEIGPTELRLSREGPPAIYPPDPMRILVLNSIFDVGGAERITYDLVKRLTTAKHDVVFCSLYQRGQLGAAIAGAGYRFYDRLMRNRWDVRVLFKLRNIVRAHQIDLIYLAVQPLTLFWGVICSKATGVPIVALVSNTVVVGDHLKLRSYRWLLPSVSRIVAVAEGQRERLIAETGVKPDLVSVVHNGVEIQRFVDCHDDPGVRQSFGLRPATRVVGVVARLVPLKAIDVFLQAAKIVTDSRSNVEFAIVGSGPERERLTAQARLLGIEQHVRFVGFVDDPCGIIGCFDVAVLCSRTEALPIAVLEYMATGKPCVVTDVGSLRELIDDDQTGYLVQPDDPQALAGKIRQLLDNPGLASEIGAKGREVVARRFSLDVMVNRTLAIFQDCKNLSRGRASVA